MSQLGRFRPSSAGFASARSAWPQERTFRQCPFYAEEELRRSGAGAPGRRRPRCTLSPKGQTGSEENTIEFLSRSRETDNDAALDRRRWSTYPSGSRAAR
jgi:hypothetical protein